MSCENCTSAYDAIKNNHKNCFLKVKNNRKCLAYECLCEGGGYTLIGYSALEVKNHDFTLFLLKDKELKNEQSQLGFNCLYEALLYNNKFYYDLFLKEGVERIDEYEKEDMVQKYGLTKFSEREYILDDTTFEKEDMNW